MDKIEILNFKDFRALNEEAQPTVPETQPATQAAEPPQTTETTTVAPTQNAASSEFYAGFKKAVEQGNPQVKDVDDTTKEYVSNGQTYVLRKVQ